MGDPNLRLLGYERVALDGVTGGHDLVGIAVRVRVEQEYAGQTLPLPPHWGGYRLAARRIEFWQGRPSRLHDRLLYTRKKNGSWKRERLSF